MTELDAEGVIRLAQMAEAQDIAFLHVKVGDSELVVSRMSVSEMAELGLSGMAGDPGSRRLADLGSAGSVLASDPALVEPAKEAPDQAVGSTGAVVRPAVGSTIDAPMVGTFYRSSSPEEPPFVEPGSLVEEGMTVGLIEAMKVFTAVTARERGIVSEVLVSNGAFVEFGQPLVRLGPATDGLERVKSVES